MVNSVTRNLLIRVDFRRPRHLVTFRRRTQLPDPVGGFRGQVLEIRILVRNRLKLLLTSKILPNSDVLHLGRDDPLIGIPLLCNRMPIRTLVLAGLCTQRLSFQAWIFLQPIFRVLQRVIFFGVRFGQVTVVLRLYITTLVLFHIAAILDPLQPHRWQSLGHIATISRIPPRPRAIVDSYGFILFNRSVGMLGIGKSNLPEGNAEIGMNLTLNVDPCRVREQSRIVFDRTNLIGVVQVLSELTGIVASLFYIAKLVNIWLWIFGGVHHFSSG